MSLWRVFKLAMFFAAAGFVCTAVFVRVFILDQAELKDRFSKTISAKFMRDYSGAESIDVGWLSNGVTLEKVRISEAFNFHAKYPAFLTIDRVSVTFDRWAFVRSGCRRFSNLSIVVEHPVIAVERRGGVVNVDELSTSFANLDLGRYAEVSSVSIEFRDATIRMIENGTEREIDHINGVTRGLTTAELWKLFQQQVANVGQR